MCNVLFVVGLVEVGDGEEEFEFYEMMRLLS